MPPKRKKAQQGESKTGLVVALVFFIVTTLGLAFSTYTGYSAVGKEESQLSKAKQDLANSDKERDWYRFQSKLYLSYLGQLQADDKAELGSQMELFKNGSLGNDSFPDYTRVKALTEAMDKEVPWDPQRKELRTSYQGLLAQARKQYETLQQNLADAQKLLAVEEKKARDAQDLARTQLADFTKQLKDLTDKVAVDNTELLKKRTELLAEVEKLGKRIAELETEKDTIRTALAGEKRDLLTKIDSLDKQLKERSAEISALKERTTQAPKNWSTKWRINSLVDGAPYINLGSADKVTPQLTFSIHSLDSSGTPVQESKGTLEIVDVIASHLSRAKITSVTDPNKDPIVEGDILFNPSWDPKRPKRIAIAGLVDLDGDNREDLEEFKRKLLRHNMILDAIMDPKDFSVQGEVTVQTDFLLLGNGPEALPNTRDRIEVGKNLTRAINDMLKNAESNGVEVVSVRKFLDQIGYVPR